MRPASAAFRAAALSGAPVVTKAWVTNKGRTVLGPELINLTATVDCDEFAASRHTLHGVIADPDGALRPRLATDALAPFGNELVVQAGFDLTTGAEYVQIGVFRLEVSESALGTVTVTGYDRSYVITRADDEQPHVIAAGTSLAAAIAAWVAEKYPGIEFFADPGAYSATIDSTLVYEDGDSSGDPWTNMRKLALLYGRELFVDWRGAVILRPVPTQTTGPYAAIYKPGDYNMVIKATTNLSPGDLSNVVRVIGQGSSLGAVILGVAEVDDPADPLYAGPTGAFGRRPLTIRSPAVSTQEQADAAAAATLAQRKGVSENVALTLAPLLQHEPGDIVAFTSERQRITAVLALSRWSIETNLRSPMAPSTRLLRPAATQNVPTDKGIAAVAASTGTAYAPTIRAGNEAPAATAAAAGAAYQPSESVQPSPSAASGVGEAEGPATSAGRSAPAAAATGAGAVTGAAPSVKTNAGSISDSGTANAPATAVKTNAGSISDSGTANAPAITTGPTYDEEVAADSPLIWLKFNETSGTNFDDQTVNNRDGTAHGTITLAQTGPITTQSPNRAIRLDGSTGYVSTGFNPFGAGTTRTFEIWVYRENHSAHHAPFGSSGGAIWAHLDSDGDLVAFFPDENSSPTVWDGAFPGDNQWVHLVFIINDSGHTARLYVNGVDKGQNTGIAPYGTKTNVNIGCRGTTLNFLPGYVDEFAIYDGALSAARVLAHYDAAT